MKLKEKLLKELNLCVAIADDILQNDKSREAQLYAKKFAEIESPLVGGTDCHWIRINFGDIYLFLYDSGSSEFQVDPLGAYGGELIAGCSTKEALIEEILKLEKAPIIRDGCMLYDEEDGYEDNIPMYIQYNPDKLVHTFPSQLDADEVGDFIVCTNCGKKQLIKLGSEFCKFCNSENLQWADEDQEVSLSQLERKGFFLLSEE